MRPTYRTLVIADLHLASAVEDRAALDALVAFLDHHAHADGRSGLAPGERWRLVVAGDLFDLEARRGRAGRRFDPRPAALADALARDFAEAFAALRRFSEAGHRVVLCAGNHDAALLEPLVAARVRREIGAGAQVVAAWADAPRGLLVTHGQQLDPDNRFALWPSGADGDASLGVLLTRLFVGPLRFRPRTEVETTPLKNLLSVLVRYGWRAPAIILGYLAIAAWIVLRYAGPRFRALAERAHEGTPRDGTGAAAAELDGLAAQALATLEGVAAPATLADRWRTFHRLYLGRVAVTLLAAGALATVLSRPPAAWTPYAAIACVLLPLLAFALRGNRYGARVRDALERGGRALVEADLARTVVFGHLHHRQDVDLGGGARYLNPGMFHTARGESYVVEASAGDHRLATFNPTPAADPALQQVPFEIDHAARGQ